MKTVRLSLVLAMGLVPALGFAQPLGFVLNSDSASISLIDMATHRPVGEVPVLRQPHHITRAPDGRFVLVGDTVGNQILYLDPRTGRVVGRQTISDPYQLMFSPDGRLLTITGLARNQVDIYRYDDRTGLTLWHRVPARSMPSHIAYAPDSSAVYVSLQGSNRLMAIATGTGAVLWDARVGETPAGVLWNDGALLVGLMGQDGIAVVDPADGQVRRMIKTGRGAHNLFFSPDDRLIYVTNRVAGTISVLDRATLRVVRDYRVPGGPDDIEFAPDGTLWITQRFDHGVLFLDPETGRFSRVDVGRSPHGLFLNTDQTTHRTAFP